MREHEPDLAALTRSRPEALDPAQLGGSRRQHDDLVAIMSTPQPESTARPRRYRWVALPVAGVAVATAGVVAVVSTLSGPTASTATPRLTVPHQHSATDGRVALLNVASAIEHETGSGDYWQQNTTSGNIGVVQGTQPYAVLDTGKATWLIGVKPGEQSTWTGQQDETREPRTATDRARWQAAGSPTSVPVDYGFRKLDGTRVPALTITIGSGHPTTSHTNINDTIAAVGPHNVTYADLTKLPSDTAGLAKLFDRYYAQDGGSENAGDHTEWLWGQASGLIQLPVSGDVRAAAYRIIADLPGIQSLGTVTDALGRTGVGVALPAAPQGDLGTARRELIVDPRTNTLLADETVLVTPSALATAAGLTAGTELIYQATTEIGWTNQNH